MVFPLRNLVHRIAAAGMMTGTLLLAACGGGGSDSSSAPPPAPAFPTSSSLANMCTPEGQKRYVRSYLDEIYLWYNEIPSVVASDYPTVPAYFNALLVKTPDSNGQPKDRFSAALTSAAADALQSVSPAGELGAGVPAALLSVGGKSVPVTTVVTSPNGRRVGYILFNDHSAGAQDELIAAFQSLRSSGVGELVLDMRYNTGGFLYVAQTAASMVAGPQSEGRTFEQLRYNNKRLADTAASTFVFSSKLQTAEKVFPAGAPLPQLNLPRLYVLTSGQTCSASESIVNSLRGIDIEVILVGSTTCGKPYGFHRQDNCGLAFFALEFQGFNAKNFGDYSAGLKATCPVADNFTSTLGSTTEPLMAGALRHIDTGICPPASGTSPSVLSQGELADLRANAPATVLRPLGGRLLQPGLQR